MGGHSRSVIARAAAALLLLAPGCASVGKPPGQEDAHAAPGGAAAPRIALRPLLDWRPASRSDLAEPDEEVSGWATRGVRAELERAGLRVVGSDDPAEAVLGGEVETVFCEKREDCQATVTIRAWLEVGGARRLERKYTGEGSGGGSTLCLARALRSAAAKIARDARAEGTRDPGQPSAAEPAPTAAFGERPSPLRREFTGFLFGELVGVGVSALAARWPSETGGVLVVATVLSPLSYPEGTTIETFLVAAGGFLGIGLYDALELRGRGYTRGQRFWLNLGAWTAVNLAVTTTALLTAPVTFWPGPSVALGVGLQSGAPALLLSGRF